jgi:hypothetical protein
MQPFAVRRSTLRPKYTHGCDGGIQDCWLHDAVARVAILLLLGEPANEAGGLDRVPPPPPFTQGPFRRSHPTAPVDIDNDFTHY